jgi:hypothetical protein
MHIQARALAQKSPPDLVEFLRVLAGVDPGMKPINIEGVTGSSLEDGGHFVFAVEHEREQECHTRLANEGYRCQWTKDLYQEMIPPDAAWGVEPDPNQPGVLLGIVERAKGSQIAGGRPILTLLLGAVTNEPGRFFAQVTFVGADWQDEVPTDDEST